MCICEKINKTAIQLEKMGQMEKDLLFLCVGFKDES